MAATGPEPRIRYTTITGYFLQDDAETNAEDFDYRSVNLGLKDRLYERRANLHDEHGLSQWQLFEQEVLRLNRESDKMVNYKVLFLGRHGQGVHNVAESYYGTIAWDLYWAKRDSNETVNWGPDAHLTETGVKQALSANAFWAHQIKEQQMPLPQSFYTSPLHRCLATASLTFGGHTFPTLEPFKPTVKELLREANGVHTCDRRGNKTYIHEQFPEYTLEPGFTDTDELWTARHRESDQELDVRLRKLLDDIFDHDHNIIISLTSHSGAIASILRVVGHRKFRLVTGSVIPLLVKAETQDGL